MRGQSKIPSKLLRIIAFLFLVGFFYFLVSIKITKASPGAFTSAATGNWNASATWGNTGDPAVEGTDYPGNGDTFTIANTHTVTVNGTYPATGDLGAGTVQSGGTLDFLYSTTTGLDMGASLTVDSGGTLNMGTTVNPIASANTCKLRFNNTSDGQYGLIINGTWNGQGATKTTVKTLLTADAAAAQAVLTVASTSGWAVGDELGIASTTRTYSEAEKKIISTVDSATQVTLTTNLTNAHSGTSPTQGEVINLTRNCLVTAKTTTYVTYIVIGTASTVDLDYVEVSYIGVNATDKYGVTIKITTGSCNIAYSSVHDSEYAGFWVTGTTHNNWTLSYNVIYGTTNYGVYVVATSGTNWTIDNCVTMYSSGSVYGFYILDAGGTFTNNTATSFNSYGMLISATAETYGTFSGNTAHSNASFGVISYVGNGTLSSTTSWRNNNPGLLVRYNVYVDGATLFGNATSNLDIAYGKSICNNITANSESGYTTASGMRNYDTITEALVKDSSFGATTAHTQDILIAASSWGKLFLKNTTLASSTEVSMGTAITGSEVFSEDHDASANSHYAWQRYGQYYSSTTYYRTASPGLVFKPSDATYEIEYEFWAAVPTGTTPTLTFYASQTTANEAELAFNGSATIEIDTNYAYGLTLAATAISFGNWNTWTSNSPTITGTTTRNAVVKFIIKVKGTIGRALIDDVVVSW